MQLTLVFLSEGRRNQSTRAPVSHCYRMLACVPLMGMDEEVHAMHCGRAVRSSVETKLTSKVDILLAFDSWVEEHSPC